MAGPGDETAPGTEGHGHLRASDSDRAHMIDTLKAAYVDGLVTKDEFDARVSQTFASRTHAELALVTADLPAGLAAAQQRPAPARGNAPADAIVTPGARAIIATAVFAALALVTSVHAGPFASPAAFVLLLGGTGSAFRSLFLLRNRMRSSRRDKRFGGQLPPQRGIDTGPRAPSRAISAAPAEKPPHASKPRRGSRANAARNRIPGPQVAS
jgi:hypothetical protein